MHLFGWFNIVLEHIIVRARGRYRIPIRLYINKQRNNYGFGAKKMKFRMKDRK